MKPVDDSSERFTEYYLDLRKSMLLVEDFTTRYNQNKPLRKQLRACHVALIQRLLDIQRTVLWTQQSGRSLLPPDMPLPYLSTNNAYLGKKTRCSTRTIQNLRHRLREAGLILDEIWHGSKANYEIRLNPEVIFLGRRGDRRNWISLFEGKEMMVDACEDHQDPETINIASVDPLKTEDLEQPISDATEVWKTAAAPVEIPFKQGIQQGFDHPSYEEKNTVFSENFSSKCTLSLPDTNQLNQLEIDPCGKAAGTDADRSGDQRRIFLTGYETDSDEPRKPPRVARRPPVGREQGTGGVQQTFGEVVQELPEKLGRRIFREVSKVWAMAREELYVGEWIADTERERAKARLAEYYLYAQPERYEAGTAEICERIQLVRKWIDRGRQQGQERWVPIPSVYFDYRNGRGFSRTKAWFKKHMAKRREIGDNIAVAKAVGRYQRCVEDEQSKRGPLEIYQELRERLRERGEEVMIKFCDAVML